MNRNRPSTLELISIAKTPAGRCFLLGYVAAMRELGREKKFTNEQAVAAWVAFQVTEALKDEQREAPTCPRCEHQHFLGVSCALCGCGE